MEKNLDGGELITALIQVQGELAPIVANHMNKFTTNAYLDLPEILKVSKPILTKRSVLLQQFVDINGAEHRVTVTTMLTNGKESLTCGGSLGPTEMKGANETQRLGASCTYLRRFQAMTMLGIAGAEDDEEGDFRDDEKGGEGGSTAGEPQNESQNPELPKIEERTNLIKSMTDIVGDPVFSEDDKVIIRSSIKAAKGDTAALKSILIDIQEAFDEKKAKAEPTQKELIDE